MSTTNGCNLEIEIEGDLSNDDDYDRLFRLIQLLTKKNNYLEGLLDKTKEKYIPETSIDTKSDQVADSTGGGGNTPNTPKLIDFIFTGEEERKPTIIKKGEINTGDLRKKILGFKFTNLILGYSMFITDIKGGENIVLFEGVFPNKGNKLEQVKTYFSFEEEDLSSMVLNLNGKYYTYNFNGKNIKTSDKEEDLETDLKEDLEGNLEKRLEEILKYFCPLLEGGKDFKGVLEKKNIDDGEALEVYESDDLEESKKEDYLAIIYSDFFSKNKQGKNTEGNILAEPYIQIKNLKKKITKKKMPGLLDKYKADIDRNNRLTEAQANIPEIKFTIYKEVIQELYSYLCNNEKYIENIINMDLDYGIKKVEGNNTIQEETGNTIQEETGNTIQEETGNTIQEKTGNTIKGDITELCKKTLFDKKLQWEDHYKKVQDKHYYTEKSPAGEEDPFEYIKNILDTDEGLLGAYETNIKEIFTDLDNRYKGEKGGEWDEHVAGSDPAAGTADNVVNKKKGESEFIIIYLAKKIADEWIQKFSKSKNNIPLLHIIEGEEEDEIDQGLEEQLMLLREETPPDEHAVPTFSEEINIDEGRDTPYEKKAEQAALDLGNLCNDDLLDKEKCDNIFNNPDELNNVYKKAYNMYRNHLIKQLYKNLSRVNQNDEIIDKLLKLIFALKELVGEDDSSISNEYEKIKDEDKGKIKGLEEKEGQGVINKTVIDRKINAERLGKEIEGQGLSDAAMTDIITLAKEYLKAEMEWRDQLGFWDSLSRQLRDTKGKDEQALTKEDIIVFSKYLNNQQKILKELSQKMSVKRKAINTYEDIKDKDQVFQFIEKIRLEIVEEREQVKK